MCLGNSSLPGSNTWGGDKPKVEDFGFSPSLYNYTSMYRQNSVGKPWQDMTRFAPTPVESSKVTQRLLRRAHRLAQIGNPVQPSSPVPRSRPCGPAALCFGKTYQTVSCYLVGSGYGMGMYSKNVLGSRIGTRDGAQFAPQVYDMSWTKALSACILPYRIAHSTLPATLTLPHPFTASHTHFGILITTTNCHQVQQLYQ